MTTLNKDEYFNFGVATSVVLFGFDGEKLRILTVPQKEEPFKNGKILPSRYVKVEENIEAIAGEMVYDFVQKEFTYIEQLKAFANVYRNPIGRVINIAYYALIKLDDEVFSKTSQINGEWILYEHIPELAFDHNDIINYAKERLKRRVKRRPIGFFLLPEKFTILQLQNLYEQALNKELDKRNFRKKIFKSDLIIETEDEDTTSKKPAKLYRFDQEEYAKLTLKGYDFLF